MKYCLIVPHYNHAQQFVAFLPKLLESGLPAIVIDDGSDAGNCEEVRQAVGQYQNVYFFSHPVNRGKGAAVKTAVCHARNLGFTHGIQIDSDGQHAVNDIEKFVALSEQSPEQIICGRPTFDETVPKIRLYGRKITDFWVVLETLSLTIKDGLCGFRVYPFEQFEQIVDHYYIGCRMDFDTDILVKAIWLGIKLKFIDTEVKYPEDGASHFQYLRDNLLLVKLHTRLMLGVVPRVPILLYRKLVGK